MRGSVEVAHAPGTICWQSAHKYVVPSITCSVDLVIVLFSVGNTCHTLLLYINSRHHWHNMSRPWPTPVTHPVERLVSLEVFLLYWSNLDLAHHSQSQTCIMHLTSAKSILDPWHIPLLVFMALFLYLLCLPCFHPCLHSPPLVYFIDLVPFLFPSCAISECLLVTIYTPSCLISYKYPSTSPCICSLKSTKSLLPIPSPCSLCLTGTYARGQCLTSVIVPNQSPVLLELFSA